jgi:L-aspartate oxidase
MEKKADVLIIGAGIAGLAVGIKLALRFPAAKIILLSKDNPGESNSRYAQGGIAVVMDTLSDSFQQHINDTLLAGDGLCNEDVVEFVVREGPERLNEVMCWGAQFDLQSSGIPALGLEGGHSANRIVHAKDATGFELVKSMLALISTLPNVEMHWNTFVLDLITGEGDKSKRCLGATYTHQSSEWIHSISASFTILATGGVGQVYAVSTNPNIATGDGVAMAYRAGAAVADMQFIQFHPTALNLRQGEAAYLVSEALRGYGAYLCTEDGNRFMFSYDSRGELAPRDVVARAIYTELQKHCVYLDCRHLVAEEVIQQFPNIYQTCLASGINITIDLIPVVPAAHYLCGGIVTDCHARSTIQNLYAVGECARTGLHGANRLASNSLLEALVFAHRCYSNIKLRMPFENPVTFSLNRIHCNQNSVFDQELTNLQKEIKKLMLERAGIVRAISDMQQGLDDIMEMQRRLEHMNKDFCSTGLYYETLNLLTVAQLILQQSLHQTENRGTFFNADLIHKKSLVREIIL